MGSLASVAVVRRLASQPIEGVDMSQTPEAPQTEESATASDEPPQARRRRGERWGAVAVVIALVVTATSAASLIAEAAGERVAIGELPVPEGATAAAVFNPGPATVFLALPTIGVESELEDLRLAADGTLNVPRDAARAGWWSQGVAPGDPGPADS